MFSVVRHCLRAHFAPFVLLTPVVTLVFAFGAPALGTDGTFLLAALWLLAILAGLALAATLRRLRSSRPALLTRRALRRPPLPLPPLRQMRAELTGFLVSPAPFAGRPESPEHAIRRILERGLAGRGARRLSELSQRELSELWLLVTLLRATPEHAGGLARCFRLPDMVLDLHERVTRIAAAHAAARPLARSA